ncbi:two-component system, OmpR family, sensor histidine kinase QseC [Nitratireductor aquibiodomus]|uniref:histidine kinase n=1 Tax=Nitratireductor aquibiodomus TaxID=204799 RepID=A0A1H4IYC6_9HYPH|nr:ATP-binding protein [Nitratireductor aquibiodomus]SEB39043.1 two-component system, OmpR family, sensor histidine kinase QseC [Nitratireductor aquibiodomus]
MRSIRARLILILMGSTGLVWLLAVGWIYLSTQAEVERVLDARLMEAARMVNSLLSDHRIEVGLKEGTASHVVGEFEHSHRPYERQLSCQIWTLEGSLVGRSENAPTTQLSEVVDGFSETDVEGERWRVFTVENERLGVRVMVGDSLKIRESLVSDVITGLVVPALLILPFLAGVILVSVRRGLSPLSDMADTLSQRAANDLRPLQAGNLPKEIAPAVSALNGLFKRVEDARDRERSFTAFAAHELKTPLAGVKTQAQIALASDDPALHANALRQITAGVDRTSRLVKQLLDITALEANDAAPNLQAVRAQVLLKQSVAELPLPSGGARLVVEGGDGEDALILAEPHFLSLALRNLIENALNHSPENSMVVCRVEEAGRDVRLVVEDEGPGIPEAEISTVVEKFVRGRNRSATGSGLGLAIAQAAMARIGGALGLENRSGGGLRAVLTVRAVEAGA